MQKYIFTGFLWFSLVVANSSFSKPFNEILEVGFTRLQMVTKKNIESFRITGKEEQKAISHFCEKLNIYFKRFRWDKNPCGKVNWQANHLSASGNPLVYATFGNGSRTTLILGGVHPDELTPIPIAFRFADKIQNMEKYFNENDIKVVVAPLVNPDGFLRKTPTRGNSNGVDLNRNFFTMDWYQRAQKWWSSGKRRNPRHFPGYFPHSEIETYFQLKLLDKYVPDKIISLHAPLGFLDYDGPGDRKARALSEIEKKAKKLAEAISEKSENYRIVDYSFYPGSLGNFAGNERGIPTITLELMTTDPKKMEEHWRQFMPGLLQSVKYPFKKAIDENDSQNATRFSRYYLSKTKGFLQY